MSSDTLLMEPEKKYCIQFQASYFKILDKLGNVQSWTTKKQLRKEAERTGLVKFKYAKIEEQGQNNSFPLTKYTDRTLKDFFHVHGDWTRGKVSFSFSF